MSKINKVKHTREAMLALIGGTALLMSGCTGSEDSTTAEDLNQITTTSGLLMPESSPWRTDIDERSHFLLKAELVDKPVEGETGYITDAFAASANKIIDADRAYKGSGGSGGASPGAIASASNADYDNNEFGLVTGNTLKSWIDDWTTSKANLTTPLSGKLVILQVDSGPTGFEYVAPDGTDVFTYAVASDELIQMRDNGVVLTKSMVPDGQTVDRFLRKFDIDPQNDMIVCAMGTGGYFPAMKAGRCWYMMRYWGVAQENLAVLNGGNEWIGTGTNTTLDDTYFTDTASTPSYAGTASVADLTENNYALQATLQDMMYIVPDTDTNLLDDGVFIWDARSSNQYSPTSDADFQSGAVQGHPNGALNLNFTNLLDSAAGYTYKSQADINTYMQGDPDADGNGFIDSTLQVVGNTRAYQPGDTVYTYCETTYRAMITGFASAAILGLPTRFYDGAMTEWHAVSAVPAITSYTTVSSDVSSGGASLPANPCGG
jgi:3-mercaptopyruvate sulfurtransferase SseA